MVYIWFLLYKKHAHKTNKILIEMFGGFAFVGVTYPHDTRQEDDVEHQGEEHRALEDPIIDVGYDERTLGHHGGHQASLSRE